MTFRRLRETRIYVIPAQAGIQIFVAKIKMDPGLRRDDEQNPGHPELPFDIETNP